MRLLLFWVRGNLIRSLLTGLLGLASIALLAWGYWPTSQVKETLVIPDLGAMDQALAQVPPGANSHDSPSTRVTSVTVTYPRVLRLGDRGVVQLQVRFAGGAGASTPRTTDGGAPEADGEARSGESINVPVIGEARLELSDAVVTPPEDIRSPVPGGGVMSFTWMIVPRAAGSHRGTAWFVLVFPGASNKATGRTAVAAQTVAIEVATFLLLSGPTARAVGGLLLAAGVAVALFVNGTSFKRRPRSPRAQR